MKDDKGQVVRLVSSISDAALAEESDTAEVTKIVINLDNPESRSLDVHYAVKKDNAAPCVFSFKLNSHLTLEGLVPTLCQMLTAALSDHLLLPDVEVIETKKRD